MCKKRPFQKFRQYDQWAVTPVSEYRGLTEAERKWLEDFNTEWAASNVVETPRFNEEQRRESYRRKYHRMKDALRSNHWQLLDCDLEHDPVPAVERTIDKYQAIQRRIRTGKK